MHIHAGDLPILHMHLQCPPILERLIANALEEPHQTTVCFPHFQSILGEDYLEKWGEKIMKFIPPSLTTTNPIIKICGKHKW